MEKKCHFFSRLDAIWGSGPNFRPPSHYSSGPHCQETEMATRALIDSLTTGSNTIRIDNNDHDRQQQNTLLQSSSVIPTGYVLFSFTFFLFFFFS